MTELRTPDSVRNRTPHAAPALQDILRHIESEYREMPGMSVTPIQAQRLWGLDATTCADVLRTLVDRRFLRRTPRGTFVKCSSILLAAAMLLLPFSASGQDLSDAQIAAIVVTANQVDIDAGKLAVMRSSNDKVKAFAQLMITDHTGVNKAATELVTRLGVTPQHNPTSDALRAGGAKNLAHLRTLKGAAFDQAYIDHEVAYHQQVIDALDKTLIPGATNAELKALLIKVRPAFIAHRDHAKSLQSRPPRVHTILIDGMRFQPEGLTVAPGDTVVWLNRDMVPHTATSASARFDSKEIAPGKSWTYTVGATGEFGYICTYHPLMKAILRVR